MDLGLESYTCISLDKVSRASHDSVRLGGTLKLGPLLLVPAWDPSIPPVLIPLYLHTSPTLPSFLLHAMLAVAASALVLARYSTIVIGQTPSSPIFSTFCLPYLPALPHLDLLHAHLLALAVTVAVTVILLPILGTLLLCQHRPEYSLPAWPRYSCPPRAPLHQHAAIGSLSPSSLPLSSLWTYLRPYFRLASDRCHWILPNYPSAHSSSAFYVPASGFLHFGFVVSPVVLIFVESFALCSCVTGKPA
jgi:hypothetical protein